MSDLRTVADDARSPASGKARRAIDRASARFRAQPSFAAVIGLLGLTLLAELPMVLGGPLLGMDAITQFVPWYAHLGEQLRAGVLPVWNPHVFAGAPFIADPLSGWTYLPAMLLFTALPITAATPLYLILHMTLAGVGAYLLARTLGLDPVGAFVASVAYEFTGYLFLQNTCCFAFAAVQAWWPLALLGVLLAARAGSGRGRIAAWGLAGVALSQVIAAWPGQGSLYVLVATGAWTVWWTVVSPERRAAVLPVAAGPAEAGGLRATGRTLRARLVALSWHGGAVLAVGLGLAAAGLLPRLAFNASSNLAGGYPGAEGVANQVAGWSVTEWTRLARPGVWYAGRVTLVLAAVAPFLARRARRLGITLFLACLCLAALVLASQARTPLHELLFLIPGADRLHPNRPERVLLIFYLPAALLAGSTVSALRLRTRPRRWLKAALALAVVVDLLAANVAAVAELRGSRKGDERLVRVDLDERYAASPAGAFVRAASRRRPGRYFGYRPVVSDGVARPYAYSVRWNDPAIQALEVNNEAMLVGIDDIQGYNPTHVAQYDDVIAALNGRDQDYHFTDVRPTGLDSPLLDLLNVRWVLVPAEPEVESGDPARIDQLVRDLPTVFTGGGVRVLANPQALPRAWLVHDARRVAPGEALDLLADGAVDARREVLLETAPPPLSDPGDPDADRVRIVERDSSQMVVRTASSADSLLVLSEIITPGWRATLDGRPAELLTANHAFRALALPSGEHVVELRYRPRGLYAGLGVSLVTMVVLAAAFALQSGDRKLT